MSLKFAALGDLVSLCPFDAAMRADDQTRDPGPAHSREPIVVSLGWWSAAAPREKPATGVLRRLLHMAANCPSN
jgi:hypothetical protein